MHAEPRPADRGQPRAAALAAAALLLFAAALGTRLAAAGREGPDRRPRPDALEYAEVAAALARGDGFVYPLEGAAMPPRYPPGAPLALAPATVVRGGRDAWIAAAVWSALAVVLCAVLGGLAAGRLGAAVAAAVAITSPLSVAYGGLAMSEGPVQALVAVALICAALARWRRPPGAGPNVCWLAAGGVAVAWLALTRLPLAAWILPLCVAAFVPWPRTNTLRALLTRGSFVLGPLVLALTALGALQAHLFGDPKSTGYHFWAPEVYVDNSALVLSTRWLTEVLPGYWELPHLEAYGRGMLGLGRDAFGGPLWSFPCAVLAAIGLCLAVVGARRCPVHRALSSGALAALTLLAFHLVYAWQDLRFLAPLLPIVAAFAAIATVRACAGLLGRGLPRPLASAIPAVLIATVVLRPAQFVAERIVSRWDEPPSATAALAALANHLPKGALLIVDVPAPLAREAFGDRELLFADLDSADPHLVRTRLFELAGLDGTLPTALALASLGAVENAGLERIRTAIEAGQPVFALETLGEGARGAGFDALKAAGAQWIPTEHVGLLRLSPGGR